MFPTRLAELIERERLTVWYSVPSVLTLLLTRGDLGARDLSALRWILFAGEVFPVEVPSAVDAGASRTRAMRISTGRRRRTSSPGTRCPRSPTTAPSRSRSDAPAPTRDCIAIDDEGRRVEEPGREGLLHVRGSTVMQGYFGRPGRHRRVVRAEPVRSRPRRAALLHRRLGDARRGRQLSSTSAAATTWSRPAATGSSSARSRRRSTRTRPCARRSPSPFLTRSSAAASSRSSLPTGISAQELRAHCATLLPRYMVPEDDRFPDASCRARRPTKSTGSDSSPTASSTAPTDEREPS